MAEANTRIAELEAENQLLRDSVNLFRDIANTWGTKNAELRGIIKSLGGNPPVFEDRDTPCSDFDKKREA